MRQTDEICSEVNCGKGRCETARGSLFGFKCKCENGWSRTRSNQEDDLDFLPCIIPNCKYITLEKLNILMIA